MIISTINPILSIKSGKTVGSGKVALLIFLTVLISRQEAISVFGLNELATMVLNLLISRCPLYLEKSGISRKSTFPLFLLNGEGSRRLLPSLIEK
jgi:hypothetical protein